MATTIAYKGSDLTSFSNTSKTLRTAGKYLEGDITVSSTTVLGTTAVIPSETTQNITPGNGYEGLSSVSVAGITSTYVGSGITRRSSSDVTSTIVSNQYRAIIPSGYYENNIQKGLAPAVGATTIIPSESQQTAISSGSYANGTITVAAITPTYVGTGVTTNPTITVSGPSVTIPAGYYSSQQTKTIANATLITEKTITAGMMQTSVNSDGLVSTTLNSSSESFRVAGSNGYITLANSTLTIDIPAKTLTYQLSTMAAQSITPSTSTQTVSTSGKYMTGNVTVNPIPSQYIVPSGTYTISSVDSTNTFNVTNYASAKVTITDADSIAY